MLYDKCAQKKTQNSQIEYGSFHLRHYWKKYIFLKIVRELVKTRNHVIITTTQYYDRSAGGPGFNPQSRIESYRRRNKYGTSSSRV